MIQEKNLPAKTAIAALKYGKEGEYWLNKFSGDLQKSVFPYDSPGSRMEQQQEAVVEFEFSSSCVSKLKELSKGLDHRLYMILTAGLVALLHKYTGNTDIIIGSPILKQEVEGSFINTVLALRNHVNGTVCFKKLLLDRVRPTIVEASQYQNFPIEALLYQLNMPFNGKDFPLFDAAILLENIHEKKNLRHVHPNMIFLFSRTGESFRRISGSLEYNSSFYKRDTVERIALHFKLLMERVVFNVNTPLAEIEIMSEQEKRRILYDYNNTATGYLKDKTICRVFKDQVEKTPDNIAVLGGSISVGATRLGALSKESANASPLGNVQMTYSELDEKSHRLAGVLQGKGAAPDTIVGIIIEPSVEMIIGMIGIMKAGGAYLPIDPEYPQERIDFILKDSDAKMFVTTGTLARVVNNLRSGAGNPSYLPGFRTSHPFNLAYVIYTSGSTGKPKGVLIEHRSITNTLIWRKNYYNFDTSDAVLQLASFSFDGSLMEIFPPIIAGSRLVLVPKEHRFNLEYLAEVIQIYRVTHFLIVPDFYKAFLKEIPWSLDRVKTIAVIGDSFTADLVKMHYKKVGRVKLYNEYGPTENSVCSTAYEFSHDRTAVSIGRPIDNTACYILNAEDRLNPVGLPGQLCLSGYGLARGYLNRPELTAEKFGRSPLTTHRAPLYKTGDLGRWLPDGNVEFLGRIDHQVKIRGFRIELGEIENRLLLHQGIKEAVVVAQKDNETDKYLAAYYVERWEADKKPELWPSVAEFFIYDDLLYYAMTNDQLRNNSYKAAINRFVKDKVVLDIGTGKDAILARFCVEAGAAKIYAIELLEETYKKAKETIQKLGLGKKIILIHGDTTKIKLPEQADVCVSEIVGSIGGCEGGAVILNKCRDLLKKDGVMIPAKSITKIAAAFLPVEIHKEPGFTKIPGEYVEKIFKHVGYSFDLRLCVKNFPGSNIISNIENFESLDFSAVVSEESIDMINLVINKDSSIDGFIVWLNLHTVEGEVIDILKNEHCWLPVFIPVFYPGIDVFKGDRIEAECIRTLSANKINPDYKLRGVLIRERGENIDFEYDLPHFEKSYRKSFFYQELFNENRSMVITKDTSHRLSASSLRDYLAKILPSYMIPSYFIPLDKIPLTPSGKLDRKTLPKPELKEEDYIGPRNEIEKKLINIWSDVLAQPHDKIGIDDDFFQLGGHSLKATILVSRIHKELSVKIPLVEVFKNLTVKGLSRYIESAAINRYAAIEPVEKKEYYALSSAQKRLYFLQQFDLNGTGYNIPLIFPMGKGLEKDGLEFTLKQLIVRHESLRTSFVKVNEEVAQKIQAAETIHFSFDYYEADESGSQEIIKHYIRPFDLAKAPLIRSGIIKLPDGHQTWMVDMHHIVSDGTSHTILTEDFMSLYNGYKGNKEIVLEPLRVQYKDFTQWQNRLFERGEIKAQEKYWLELYRGGIPRLNLPTDAKRPEVFTFAGDHYLFNLEREDAQRLKVLGSHYGGTLYMNMLAVMNTLFYKYTGQTDIIIGSGTAGRRHVDLQAVVGMFVNMLVMRNYPAGEKSYEDFLQEVISGSMKGFENQDVQFEELVEQLEVERDPSRNPLFDISLVVQNFRRRGDMDSRNRQRGNAETLPLPEENLPAIGFANKTSRFDITLFVHEWLDDASINIEYYTDIFKSETIRRLSGHFRNVIKGILENPSIKLKDIEVMSTEETRQVLYEFNDTARDYIQGQTIHGLFEGQVERTPDLAALIYEDQMLTYKELDRQTSRLAHYLYFKRGIRPCNEERVGVTMSSPLYVAAAVLGILKAGGAYVPVDPSNPRERMKFMIDDACIGTVISEKRFIRNLNRLQWECEGFESYLCMDSSNVYGEEELEKSELMNVELWEHIGNEAGNEIEGGGWKSSYTGEWFTKEEMDEYGNNILKKLDPLLGPEMRVLEIGCASGISMYRIAPKVGFYYATDLSRVIIEKNKKRIEEERYTNIKLSCLAAHEIDRLEEGNFDLVIINSVIQAFHGHNYLRQVIRKCIDLIRGKGYLFLGDIMDLELKKAMIRELQEFKSTNREKNYNTRTEFSEELFLPRVFFEDLEADVEEIEGVTFSNKIYTIENELTKFRYDVLITVNKGTKLKKSMQKRKYQDDQRSLPGSGWETVGLDVPSGNLAYIIYTSGTTGEPKGAEIEHRSAVNMLLYRKEEYGMNTGEVSLQLFSYSFDGFVASFFTPLLSGSKMVLVNKKDVGDIEKIREAVIRNGVSHFISVPSLYSALLEMFSDEEFSTIKAVTLAGDKVNFSMLERTKAKSGSVEIVNEYGVTECSVMSSIYRNQERDVEVKIGHPIWNTVLYILDESHGVQPVGVVGELCISGVGLARGYLNRPELTAEKFVSSYQLRITNDRSPITLYRTGDLGRWHPDGNIEFSGRIDHQVKIRGFRIESGEVENCLRRIENIKEVVVIDRADENGEKYLVAYIVSGKAIDTTELRNILSQSLPDYMMPSYFIPVEAIPLTPNGKIDRKGLPQSEGELFSREVGEYVGPRDKIEGKLVDIWYEVLGRGGPIGIDDNFFELGGHSLKATILTSKMHKIFDVRVPLAQVFKMPRIRELANYIKEKSKEYYMSIEPAEKKEYYLLSSAQKRLFILQQMNLDSTAYNIPEIIPLTAEFGLGKIEETFKNLIARHESLRLSFHMLNDIPVQVVHDEVEFEIEYYNLSTDYTDYTDDKKDTKNKEGQTEVLGSALFQKGGPEAIIKSFIRSFDMSDVPLLRVGLIKHLETPSHLSGHPQQGAGNSQDGKGGKYLLLVDMHHIISDGVSHEILVKDFLALQEGEELLPLRVQYKDFSQWQNGEREDKNLKRKEEYWLKEFEGEIPVLELPTDYLRPVEQSFEGNSINFEIKDEETRALKAMALSEGSTLFMVLTAMYTILLSKLSGQEDIVIGIPIAGRRHADLEKIIGMFVNTIALRNYPSREKTFTGFLSQVKERTLAAFENQDYPFEELVEKVTMERNISRNPLFDVMFALQNYLEAPGKKSESQKGKIKGLDIKSYNFAKVLQKSKFDLTLRVFEVEDKLLLKFEYCTKLFRKETIVRFIDFFKRIVSTVVETPGKKIAEIEIIPGEEKKQILFNFNDTKVKYQDNKLIHQLFQEQAERVPGKIAVVFEDKKLTYKELNIKANQLARLLKGKGVIPDTLVGIMLLPALEIPLGIFGALKAGGGYLPIDPGFPQGRINYMLNDSNCRLLLLQNHLKSRHSIKSNAEMISLEDPAVYTGNSAAPENTGNQGCIVYSIYTSGTTGKPKGVPVKNENLINYVNWFTKKTLLTRKDKTILTSSFAFDLGYTSIFPSLLNGGELHLLAKETYLLADKLLNYIKENNISYIKVTPSLLSVIVNNSSFSPGMCQSLRLAAVGGEAINPKDIKKAHDICSHIEIINHYGPTEATIGCMAQYIDFNRFEAYETHPTIGRPIDNGKVYILDKGLRLLPVGIPGELGISGTCLARGYLNRPELTAEKFALMEQVSPAASPSFYSHSPNRHSRPTTFVTIYSTGDLAKWTPNGTVEFLGRLDSQVKVHGYRIEPGEIESQLRKNKEIKEAVVLARKYNARDTYLCAYIVPDGKISILDIRKSLSENLPHYMIPAYFLSLEKLPLTPNGKIDQKSLPNPGAISLESEKEDLTPKNEVEERLVKIWEQVLGLEKVNITDNFFMIGGDSIKAIQIMARMRKAGYRFEMRDIFLNPTILELSPNLRRLKRIAEQSVITGVIPLTPIQIEFFNLSGIDQHHYNQTIMLYSAGGFDEKATKAVFSKIQEHHDALRMVFKKENGKIVQINQGLEHPLSLQVFNFQNRKDAIKSLEKNANRIQASINLETGPLMKLGLFKLDDGDRLLIAVHHLVTDAVSWRILLEDIEMLYNQYKKGETFELPKKSDSFKSWSGKLSEYANSESFLKEKIYWSQSGLMEISRIEKDFPVEDNYVKDTEVLSFHLDEEVTGDLLMRVNDSFGTEINDILLAAFGLAIKMAIGHNKLLISLEGHGRENIFENIDISRTVGWFTIKYPIIFDLSSTHDLSRYIKEVKETLRRVPNKGIGYWVLKHLTSEKHKRDIDVQFKSNPQVNFNYLGQFDTDLKQKSFGIANESRGNSIGLERNRGCELEVSGMIANKRLVISIIYSHKQFKRETIKSLLNDYKASLIQVISHCLSRKEKELTPSDLTYNEININDLEAIQTMIEGI